LVELAGSGEKLLLKPVECTRMREKFPKEKLSVKFSLMLLPSTQYSGLIQELRHESRRENRAYVGIRDTTRVVRQRERERESRFPVLFFDAVLLLPTFASISSTGPVLAHVSGILLGFPSWSRGRPILRPNFS
jgi:hypothetical protein